MQQTVKLKPDYRDAYYALGLVLHQQAVDTNGKVVNAAKQQEAVKIMKYLTTTLAPGDTQAVQALQTWGEK